MPDVMIPFAPKPEDLRFFSNNQAIRYARNGGFTVKDEGGGPEATRADMPGVRFQLEKCPEKPDRRIWVRR